MNKMDNCCRKRSHRLFGLFHRGASCLRGNSMYASRQPEYLGRGQRLSYEK